MEPKRNVRNCNVVVIGGAGFLGSQLVDYLIEDRGCKVLVLDNFITGNPNYINPAAKFMWFDIRGSHYELANAFIQWNAKFVFNYAAEPFIPNCYQRPHHFFDINAVAVLNVLEACRLAEVEGLIQMSSAEIYGDCKGKIREDDPVIPHSTYGSAKLAADSLVQVRWRESQTPAIALRQFNCVGPRETHRYVIPEIIEQLSKGHTLKLGNNSTRDFLYSVDAVWLAVLLLEHGNFGEVYNVGSEEPIKIYDLARLIAKLMEVKDVKIEEDEARKRPWEIWHLQSDNTKLWNTVGYRRLARLETALKKTIEFYRKNNNRWDWV